MYCALCGTAAVRDDQRFCARCGGELRATSTGAEPQAFAVAEPTVLPPPPPPAYSPGAPVTGPIFADDAPTVVPPTPYLPPVVVPTAPSQPPRRRRGPVILLAIAALLAAGAGAGGAVLLLGSGDEEPSSAAARDRDADRPARSTEPSEVAEESASASESVTPTEEARTFRCWSGGAPVADLAECGNPTGPDGLRWVFPSADQAGCTEDASAQRASEIECAPGGVRFHYSEWRSRTALEQYYGGIALASIDPPSGRGDLTAFQVASRESGVDYKVAIYYTSPATLWSVTIYAADESQYRAVVGGLEVRQFRDLRGRER